MCSDASKYSMPNLCQSKKEMTKRQRLNKTAVAFEKMQDSERYLVHVPVRVAADPPV